MAATERPRPGPRPGRNPFSVFLLLFLALAFTSGISALSNSRLNGIVHSEEGEVIPGAEITVAGTALKTIADFSGNFSFEHLPPGKYRLEITAPGFQTAINPEVEVFPDIPAVVDIRLERKTYYLGKITVRGKAETVTAVGATVITRREIERSRAKNFPELLENINGVFLQKSGPLGKTQIRLRGSNPDQVLVLLDGQRLNNASDGRADLAAVPLEMVERVEIYAGGASARFGPDALAGAVNIITRPESLLRKVQCEGESRLASWDTEEYRLTARDFVPTDNLSLKFGGHWRRTAGDYDFEYAAEGVGGGDTVHTGTRLNNTVASHDIFITGIYRFSPKISIDFSGQIYSSRQGLPDRATRQNQFAFSRDNRLLAGSSLSAKAGPADLKLELAYSRYDQRFLDTLSEPVALQFNTRSVNDNYTAKLSGRRPLWSGSRLDIGTEYRLDKLNHDDILRQNMSMGKTSRDNLGLYGIWEQKIPVKGFPLMDQISWESAGRFDFASTQRDSVTPADAAGGRNFNSFSPYFGAGLSRSGKLSYSLRGDYGRSLRLPALNALFWKGDLRTSGNPNLKPEKSEHSQAEFQISLDLGLAEISCGTEYFHSRVNDLIVWQPNFQGVWQPQNLASARITGRSDQVTLSLKDDLVKCRFQNSLTTALNQIADPNQYGRRLVFYPHYITSLTLDFKYHLLTASYRIRWVDEVYVNNANTRSYPDYRLDDFRIGFDFTLNHHWHFTTGLDIDNLRDIDYVLMPQYPMPGRQWSASFKIRYGLDQTN